MYVIVILHKNTQKYVHTRNFTLWIGTHAQLETIKTQDPTVDR